MLAMSQLLLAEYNPHLPDSCQQNVWAMRSLPR